MSKHRKDLTVAAIQCRNHVPVQHRDAKPAWCKACGLTWDFRTPERVFDHKGRHAVQP